MRMTQAEKSLYGYDEATRTPTKEEIREEEGRDESFEEVEE